jgi:hypothetical protein
MISAEDRRRVAITVAKIEGTFASAVLTHAIARHGAPEKPHPQNSLP